VNTTRKEANVEQLSVASCFAGDLQETRMSPSACHWNNTEDILISQNGKKATIFIQYHRTMAVYPTMPDVE